MNHLKVSLFVPLFVILSLFFLLRIQNIQSIPVFCDEAIYVRWSQLIKNVETLRFVPLTDGKQPLFMWLTAASFKFISDPLLAGRLISVFSGAGIIITIYLFCLLFFNQKTAIISAIVYLVLPFTFFFDRLALADTLLSFFGTVSLLFAFLLAKYPRLDLSLILGFSLGLAGLTKSPAIYFVVLSLLTFVLFDKTNFKKAYFPTISSILAFIIYNILRLGPQFHQIALRNLDYIWSIKEILRHPLDPLLPHISDIITIYTKYISLPLLAGIIFIKRNKLSFLLFLWWFLPLMANAAMAKVFTARYILFTLPPLIILISHGISSLKHRLFWPIFLLLLLPNLYSIYQISFHPQSTALPSTELGYTSSWTSGWGIKEAGLYLIERSRQANVIVGTEGYFGTLPDGLQIYTDSLPQLTVFGVGVDINQIPAKLIDARNHGDEVYLLFNNSRLRLTPEDYTKLTLVQAYDKPGLDQLLLYRLN